MTTAPHLDNSLPALTEPNAGAALPPPPGLRVICVDDNADAADSLGTLLDMVGCDVTVAHDAKSALARVEEFQPEVCILDVCMPGMDGCELARHLRENPGGERLLLVALTALGDHNSLERMADAGFDLHFAKPVTPRDLYQALNTFADARPPRAE
jgi:two-component system, OmpR family, response regulator